MEPLVSIVVPAYNVGQYLDKCIESLKSQTYKNIEVILVDDGSTDNVGEICDEAADQDRRFKVIHKANGGPSEARNRALDIVSGDYITFVDGDDFIAESHVETLLGVLLKEHADISICDLIGFSRNKNGEDILPEHTFTGKYRILSADDALAKMLRQDGFDTEAWGKMYRAALFDGVRFPEGMLNEDLAVIYKCFLKAEKVALCEDKLHYYRQRPDSIMGTKTDIQRYMDSYNIIEDIVPDIYKKRPGLAGAVNSRAMSVYSQSFAGAVLCGNKELADKCWAGVKRFRLKVLPDINARPKARAAALLSFLGEKAFLRAYDRFVK